MPLKAIDLFCGCGGLSLGLARAGFSVVWAVDADPLAVETYGSNHKNTTAVLADITTINPAALLRMLKLRRGELALLAGCPPCQGFSRLRTLNGRKGIDPPQNNLIFEFLRFARAIHPKAIMVENVPALADDWRMVEFLGALNKLGYSTKIGIFDAQNFGVPQRRKRMILVASRVAAVQFAKALPNSRTVRSAIGHLLQPGSGKDPLHDYSERRLPAVRRRIEQVPVDGGSRSDLPPRGQLACHRKSNGFYDVYGRMAWESPSPTITCGCINPSKGRYLHPEQHRAITLREAALLQGFPRGYKISLSEGRYRAAELIGNAFPPRFAQVHARVLHESLAVSVTNSARRRHSNSANMASPNTTSSGVRRSSGTSLRGH